jgi:predicted metalloendopeptidase
MTSNKIKNKNKNKSKNKTLKKKSDILSSKDKKLICKNYSNNNYESFEDKIEELFKKKKIDIVSTSYNLEKQIVDELKEAVNPYNVKPNQDFYSYINDRWLNSLKLKKDLKYIVQVDDFRITQDKVYKELLEIIDNYISNPSTKNSKKAKCIKNAYKSFLTFDSINKTRQLSNKVLQFINNLFLNKNNNVWDLLALMNSSEIISWCAPFVWSIKPDDKNPSIYKCYLQPPKLTLIDLSVYFDDERDTLKDKKYKANYKKHYFIYLKNLFNIAFGENHGFRVEDIFDTEVEILTAMMCNLYPNDEYKSYNLITKEESINKYGFDWENFCYKLGFKNVPSVFVTSNINYLMCGTKLLKEKWNTSKWKTYWIYIYIRQQCRWNVKGWVNYYNFEGKFVRGQEQAVDMSLRPIFAMGYFFNSFLTNEYIDKYNNEQLINYTKSMVEDLKVVFIRIIKRNSWLQKKTKEKALEKLYNLKINVGSNKILEEDELLDYKPDEPWENLMKKSRMRLKKAISLVNKKVIDIPLIDWSEIPSKFIGNQAYVVNAYYKPNKNGIYIHSAYIQKPFVDLEERGLEYNLSRIGFTIAHELSHSLDDSGSKYNQYGLLENWWTKKDIEHYKKIQDDVIKQYQTFASYDGIKFNASGSISEDLADISGLAICQEYLRDFQLKNKDILPIQSISYEAFFIYFAIQQRQKINKKAILAQLKTNPHPLDKYRCNVPLSRTNVFRAIYNVKKGDKMWWHSTNSVWQ